MIISVVRTIRLTHIGRLGPHFPDQCGSPTRGSRGPTARRRRWRSTRPRRRCRAAASRRSSRRCEEGAAARGILPMENSIGGSIHRNYDLLVEHELPIVGEIELKVDHCLMALPGVAAGGHPRRPLAPAGAGAVRAVSARACPNVEIAAVYDTAGGAKLIRERRAARRRGDRLAAGGRGLRRSTSCTRACRTSTPTSRGSSSSPAAAAMHGGGRQDDDRLCAAERSPARCSAR